VIRRLLLATALFATGCQASDRVSETEPARADEQLSSPSDGIWRLKTLTGFDAVQGQMLSISRTTYSLRGCGGASGYLPTRDDPAVLKTSGMNYTCDDREVAVQRALLSLLESEPTVDRETCGADEDCPYKIVVRSKDVTAVFYPQFLN